MPQENSKLYTRRGLFPLLAGMFAAPALLSFDHKTGDEHRKSVIQPKALKPGMTIGICATAGATTDFSSLNSFISFLEGKGFLVKEGKNTRTRYGYLSAKDEDRAAEFMDMIKDPLVDAILFTRGGWGCARILGLLDYTTIKHNPKIILGFSDITSLINVIHQKTGLVTFHGPNGNATWDGYSWSVLEQLICLGEQLTLEIPDVELKDPQPETLVEGICKGELIGGNLSVLVNLIGTDFEPNWKSKILFLEEVHEEPYRVDRMLCQMKHRGVFEQIHGLVLGQFKDCGASDKLGSMTLLEVFRDYFGKLDKPVMIGAPIGHIKHKYTLPVGVYAELDTCTRTIKMLDSAVKFEL